MHSRSAAVGSAVFFLVAPGTVAGVIPWWITGWELAPSTPVWVLAQGVGVVLIVAGAYVLVHAFTRFALARGTPAPIAPTERLVVEGFHRYVRNPMYVAVLATLLGQALLFASLWLVGYAVLAWLATALFVRYYEEPTLSRQFGSDYHSYRRHVPAWLPRTRPWTPTP